MSSWLNLAPEELIKTWKATRNDLNNITDVSEILSSVEKYFSSVPRNDRVIDYYTPSQWPRPWEILHDKTYCNSSVTLLQYYTLLLNDNIDNDKLELYLIEDSHNEFVVLVYNNKYLLNYKKGNVLDFKQTKTSFKSIHRIKKDEIPAII